MSPRVYRSGQRAQSAAETRRRIVEATFALHEEQGIVATSMKQIAARAGVSVGTVYHHFPTYDDAIAACGAHTAELVPVPTAETFEGLAPAERLPRLVGALFDYYARLPVLERARCDQHLVPQLRRFIAEAEARRRALIGAALGSGAGPRQVALAAALTGPGVHAALASDGWSTADAAQAVAKVLSAGLPAGEG